ncbi:TPA: hypothetical protein ACGO10_001056 [Streptococcus suis]
MTNNDSIFEEIKDAIAQYAGSKDNFFSDFNSIPKEQKEERRRKKAELVSDLQAGLAEELKKITDNTAWIWKTEHVLISESGRDKADIYGVTTDGKYQVIIELDPHRADAIAKKFTSRIAAVLQRGNVSKAEDENDPNKIVQQGIDKIHALKALYVIFVYLGTDKMSVNETKKYIDYCKAIGKHVGIEVVDYHTSDLDEKWRKR